MPGPYQRSACCKVALASEKLIIAAEWYRESAHSDEIAKAWLDGFLDLLQDLQFDPERHSLARESHRFSLDVHEVYYGSGRKRTHRVLFKILGQVVHVLTVRHLAQKDIDPKLL